MKTITEYGAAIKYTRERLNLYQKDLKDSGISRNHISDLESGKSKLTLIKALTLYKKFIEYSWIREIPITLEFDMLLRGNTEYLTYKRVNDTLLDLVKGWSDSSFLPGIDVGQIMNDSKDIEAGNLGFFIYDMCGDCFGKLKDYENQYLAYENALEFIQWRLDLSYIDHFDRVLKKFATLSSKLRYRNSITKYYEHLIDFKTSHNFKISPAIYFNLSLFYKKDKQFDKALNFLELYEKSRFSKSPEDYIELLTFKSTLLFNVERHNEALNIYAQLIEQLKGKKRFEALATIYSNAINFIVKCNLHEYEDLLKTAIEELHNIIYSTTFAMKEYYNHFSNLGQGRWYFKQYESAIPCFCKAFDILGDDPTHEKEVNLLIECYPCFLTVGDDDFIVTRMLNLNIHKMKGEVKLTYLKLLAKVRVTINPSITSKSLLDTLDEYIIKL